MGCSKPTVLWLSIGLPRYQQRGRRGALFTTKGGEGDFSQPSPLGIQEEAWGFSSVAATTATPTTALLKPSRLPPSLSWRDLFGIFDLDDGGKIPQPKLEDCLHYLILDSPSTDEVAQLAADINCDSDNCLSLNKFSAPEAGGGPCLVGADLSPTPPLPSVTPTVTGRSRQRSCSNFSGTLGAPHCNLFHQQALCAAAPSSAASMCRPSTGRQFTC
ncbi:hypothetical protein ZIOFF_071529 [Zingiber officinale]|uniref:Uncharacterized protein n=1 Tax=Zingiber officinale TaxID=94328 RepID=A0A8J5BED2_ZINOF|nr:hypothetical protein ZIOFF_071529 [Zingiber officinale]